MRDRSLILGKRVGARMIRGCRSLMRVGSGVGRSIFLGLVVLAAASR